MMKFLRIVCLLIALVMFGFFFLLGPSQKKPKPKPLTAESVTASEKVIEVSDDSTKDLLLVDSKEINQIEKAKKIKNTLRTIQSEMNIRKEQCEKAHKKFFKTGKEFDDFQNKTPSQLISDLKYLFTETLYRPAQIKYYEEIKELVKSETPLNPVSAYKMIKDNRICRDGKSLGAIGFVLNLSQNRSWKKEHKTELSGIILSSIKNIIGKEYTSENLSFAVAKLGSLNNHGLLKRVSTVDIKGLVRKITEQHKIFLRGFSEASSDRGRMNIVLREHFDRNEAIGLEMIDHITNELEEIELSLNK